MKKFIFTCVALLIAGFMYANPSWMRYTSISPDGEQIAFSYKGDIYVVNSQGGMAQALTTQDSYEYMPIWSPDSKTIAFASDRKGNFDIYTVSIKGGTAIRLTTNSCSELPLSFSKDGKDVYYSAYIQKPSTSVQFPAGWMTELYKTSIEGGARPEQVVAIPVMNMSFVGNDGSFFYENRTGSENEFRKHHVSSVARNIWKYDATNTTFTQLTTNVGEDRNPIYTANNKVIFLSERNGKSFNVYLADPSNMVEAKELTVFKEYPVRYLSLSNNGLMCYSYGGDIYTQEIDSKPNKIEVSIIRDDPAEQIVSEKYNSAREYAITPDGKQLALINRGEVFATTDKYSTTKQVTHTPEAERGIDISPDGKTLVYASERGGIWNVYTAKLKNDTDVNFANAIIIDEKPLFKTSKKTERFCPQFSPDGEEIAFIENRTILKVINLKTQKIRQITDGSEYYGTNDNGFNYKWSPDGKWFALEVISHVRDPYCDIAITSAIKKGKLYNITNSAYFDASPNWVMGGNAIIFGSNRLGLRAHASWGSQEDLFIAFLNQKTYDEFMKSEEELSLEKEAEKIKESNKKGAKADKKDKKKKANNKKGEKDSKKVEKAKDIDIEFARIEDHIVRLTPMSSSLGSGMITNDGKTLYFTARFEKSYDLWKVDLKKRSTKLLDKGTGSGYMKLSKDGKSLFVLGYRPQVISIPSGKSKPISITAKMDLNKTGEREYMFNHVIKQESKRFFDPNMHGVNMSQLQKDYVKFLPDINNNYDFSAMLSEVLGELNVSHTGSGYFAPHTASDDATAKLGLLYDLSSDIDGLVINEVVEYGPFDIKESKVKAGDIIEEIDGKEIKSDKDYFPLLNHKRGVRVLVTFCRPSTNARWTEVVKPISTAAMNSLMYKRWVKSRAEEVKRISNGRLGYIHIKGMNDASYRDMYSDVLGKYNQCDGIVIDTRNNGGGRLHEDVEVLFTGTKYLEQVVKGTVACEMPSRRWNKSSIMIVCEANYSNAHGTPWVYQHMKIGKIVGMPVPGTMSSVNWETLQDPTMYFGIPVIGYRTQKGNYLENTQLKPDILVENTAETVVKGRDLQLETAIKQLLKDVSNDKTRW
ncbi:MAG: S41 family peptidase [Bacteroidales bacterium]